LEENNKWMWIILIALGGIILFKNQWDVSQSTQSLFTVNTNAVLIIAGIVLFVLIFKKKKE